MTTLLTADPHLNDNPRDRYRFDFLPTLKGFIKKYHADNLFILGDLTDEKDRHSAEFVNQVVGEVHKLAEECPVTFITGNHDRVGEQVPFYGFLSKIPGISWIDNPTRITYAFGSLGRCLFLPHVHNYERDWAKIDFKWCKWIFAHNTFQGAKVGPRTFDGIPTDIFPKSAQVISGDIHSPQTFGPITYVGAPYRIDFGDQYQPRVLLIEEGKDRPKSIPCPGPQKVLMEFPLHHMEDYLFESIKQEYPAKGDILKIRVTIQQADYAQWPTIKEKLEDWCAKHGFQLHLAQPVFDSGKAGMKKVSQPAPVKSDEELLKSYAKSHNIDAATLRTGLSLIKKV